jgi:hypothetical protein
MMPTNPVRTTLVPIALAVVLAGCADGPLFDRSPARSASHPKATAVLERESSRSAANAQERAGARAPARERERDDAAGGDAGPKDTAGLQEGIRLYNDGDYSGAIRRLGARDVTTGPLATRLAGLKYTAFSYCLTARPLQCRVSFDRALRMDPAFDLAPGEHGHPLWGPVFTKAKQAVAAR